MALVHVPVTKALAAAWAKFRKENGLFLLARDANAIARGLNARQYLMERALVEYMANHAGGK
jgi:hypothetical protein